jgi:phosphohistidine phosphatase
MKLYFLRHGEAGYKSRSDFERELTDEGERSSRAVGYYCKQINLHFTAAFTSPLVRAKQTANLVLNEQSNIPLEETEFLTSDSDPKNLFGMLKSFTAESKILLVTHEPFVSTCVSTLISGSESTRIVMKPCSFACVETDGVPSRGNGKLLWLLNSEVTDILQ